MKIKNMNELKAFIEENHARSNLLIPEVGSFSSGIMLSLTEIKVNSKFEPGENRNNDIWSIDGEKFFFTKSMLDRISIALGINYSSNKVLQIDTGDDKRIIYIKHQVKYEYLSLEGITISSTTTGEYNYYEDLTHLVYPEDSYFNNKLVGKKGEIIQDLVAIRRRIAGTVAEGSAKRKALGEIIGRLKKSFSLEELKSPLLLGRAVADKENIFSEYPELKAQYYQKLLNICNLIYKPSHMSSQNIITGISNNENPKAASNLGRAILPLSINYKKFT